VIEALACGTVPIVTDIPPLRRITGGGAVGALFPPGDAGAMARMLVDWAGRDRIATRYAARDHFERALSIEALGEELRAAYQALLEEG
jgi:glycosyltransferase involved in cell wall biosynthesis